MLQFQILASFLAKIASVAFIAMLACVNGVDAEARLVDSKSDYSSSGNIAFEFPSGARRGDLFVMFLSRTEGRLPVHMHGGWRTAASCLKGKNDERECITFDDMCDHEADDYCGRFRDNRYAEDLGVVVYTKVYDGNRDHINLSWDLFGSAPGWGSLAVVRGANDGLPIRDSRGTTCDKSDQSVFNQVNAKSGDLLLMYMAFDDKVSKDRFRSPPGTEFETYTDGPDETAFLFSEKVTRDGNTGQRVTQGPGSYECKDVTMMVSVTRGSRRRMLMEGVDDGHGIANRDRQLRRNKLA